MTDQCPHGSAHYVIGRACWFAARKLLVSFTRRRLYLGPTADPEIDRLLPAGFTALPPEAVCSCRPEIPAPSAGATHNV